ncbi:MAG TPA: acyl-CoA desaturase [Thermoleophilaceae bacterium]|nr:acyl-CoA desaturase [Thermoleophilaceae bacterium]
MTETMIESPLSRLTDEQIEELGKEFDAIHDEVFDELGDRDRLYITSMIEMQRRLVVLGRILLLGSRFKPAWVAGTASLSMAKILENMEIGHNVMHGQWDWMNDPQINSTTWDWDTASTAEAWKHSHNYVHHTYTNIRGKDKDLGYEIMRIDPHQKWHPVYLLQPVYNVLLAALFEWGVALHDLDFDAIRSGEKSKKELARQFKGIVGKARLQITKDYIVYPFLSGLASTAAEVAVASIRASRRSRRRRALDAVVDRARPAKGSTDVRGIAREMVERRSFRAPFKATLAANATANIVRNVWAYAIIFCGHFPDQTYTFSEEETEDESRGAFYVRQLLGAANIDGTALFHVISGNLGYQVEHHLYPDMPSTRYAEIAPRVKDICERYDLPYNTGPFGKQIGTVQRTIIRLAFPGGKPRPKPGPYRGDDTEPASSNGSRRAEPGPEGSGPEQRGEGVRVSMPQED